MCMGMHAVALLGYVLESIKESMLFQIESAYRTTDYAPQEPIIVKSVQEKT